MTQNSTHTIEEIKGLIESIGRTGRDEVYLDNVSFHIEPHQFDTLYGSHAFGVEEVAKHIYSYFSPIDYDPVFGEVIVKKGNLAPEELVCLQILPPSPSADGFLIDMTVTVSNSDVTNELSQVISICKLVLDHVVEEVGAKAGKITFNVAIAYVLWDDVEQIVEWDEIEIPR